jgi:hypothetical protein
MPRDARLSITERSNFGIGIARKTVLVSALPEGQNAFHNASTGTAGTPARPAAGT